MLLKMRIISPGIAKNWKPPSIVIRGESEHFETITYQLLKGVPSLGLNWHPFEGPGTYCLLLYHPWLIK